jgi:hypothetical protein
MDSLAQALKASSCRHYNSADDLLIFCGTEQDSERSFQQEHRLRQSIERQFIDDFKRAILSEGSYVAELGPEVF